MRLLLLIAIIVSPCALGATGEREAALTAFEKFLQSFVTAERTEDIQPLLTENSPLREALKGENASSTLANLQQMLMRFQREKTSIEMEANAADVVARGHAPVLNPEVQKYLSSAAATLRVKLLKEANQWRVENTHYQIRYSD